MIFKYNINKFKEVKVEFIDILIFAPSFPYQYIEDSTMSIYLLGHTLGYIHPTRVAIFVAN